jgi:predicted ferric reductase
MKPLSKIHPVVGVTLVATALAHGWLALGTLFALHTGPLLMLLLIAMMLVATLGKQYKMKNWIKIHRTLDLLLVLTIIVHILMAKNIL